MPVREISDDNHFELELADAGRRLVVVDFSASWCGPCQLIAPHFQLLPEIYPNVIFLKVDVDKCEDTALNQGLTAIPTFMFFKNKKKIDKIQGIDINALAEKILEYADVSDGDEVEEPKAAADLEDYGEGLMNLNSFISEEESECINESDSHPFRQCLISDTGYLQSDFDEQLIISVTFKQAVKIHSLKLKAPAQMGPKEIKLFVNQPRILDFVRAEHMDSVQDLLINPKDLEKGTPVNLIYVKFQGVRNIQLFIKNNQSDGVITQIDYMAFIGSPLMPLT
uniref:Thioredoxin domain-containing protein n=1 Tax=Glossina palpalis gambiensis TaxID=67801 RepID=A0A1B0BI01_9MUSC